jgi:hypothetical protein
VKRAILLLVAMAAMLAFWAGVAMSQTSPGETLDANSLPELTSVADLHHLLNDFDGTAAAQTFTAMQSGALTSAQIQIYKQCETVGDIRVQIATVDERGLPTDEILAESTLPASAVATEAFPGVGDLVTVQFGDPAQVKAGKQYALILSLESPSDSCPGAPRDPSPYWLPLKGDVYPGGSIASFTPNYDPYGWGLGTGADFVFAIYVRPLGPTSKDDCKKGGYEDFGFESQGRCIQAVKSSSE